MVLPSDKDGRNKEQQVGSNPPVFEFSVSAKILRLSGTSLMTCFNGCLRQFSVLASKYLKHMWDKESLMRMEVINAFEAKEFKRAERISKKAVDNDNILIHFHYYSTNSKVQLHQHADSVDIYYVIEGKGLVTIGNEERIFKKGDIVAIPKNTAHGVINPYKKPLVMLDILAPKPKT